MGTMPVTILIVDDHGLVREGLRTLLDAELDLHVVGEAATAHEGLALARHLHPQVVVLDVRLPDRHGLQLCGDLRDIDPDVRILVCSGLADGSVLVEAAREGADGFVSKEAANAEIIDAVRRVATGAAVVGSSSAAAAFRSLRSATRDTSRLAGLTAREREVLSLLAEGRTNHEIAVGLSLAEKTVRNHVSAVLHKLGFRHRTEAALFAAPLRDRLDPGA